MNLNELNLNNQGIIKNLNCIDNIKRRLLDLGIIQGTKIIPVFKSPLNDPIAYEVRNSIIALRKEDSSTIEVEI